MIRPHEVRLVHKEMMYCSNQATAMDTAYGKFTPAAATSDTASAASTHSDVLSTNNPESMAEISMLLKRKRTDDNGVPSGAVADDEEAAVDTPNNQTKHRPARVLMPKHLKFVRHVTSRNVLRFNTTQQENE